MRRLAVLQWVALLAGAVTWFTAHLVSIGITQAECNAAGARWQLSNTAWEGTAIGISATLVLIAEVCAIVVFARTRGTEFGDGPPQAGPGGERKPSRIHFFSAASIATNAIFLMIIVLSGTADLVDIACRQS